MTKRTKKKIKNRKGFRKWKNYWYRWNIFVNFVSFLNERADIPEWAKLLYTNYAKYAIFKKCPKKARLKKIKTRLENVDKDYFKPVLDHPTSKTGFKPDEPAVLTSFPFKSGRTWAGLLPDPAGYIRDDQSIKFNSSAVLHLDVIRGDQTEHTITVPIMKAGVNRNKNLITPEMLQKLADEWSYNDDNNKRHDEDN